MKKSTVIGVALAASVLLMTTAFGKDLGSQDVLRLSQPTFENGKYTIAVHVTNDQSITAFDIPLRFGQPGDPIRLVSVDFTDRVANWDFTNAQVDNDAKTVILGLIAVVGRIDQSADLAVSSVGNTAIANLVFQKPASYEITCEPFTTTKPGHELTFLYYRYETDRAYVESFSPKFEVESASAAKVALPKTFALSANFPNPFNPTTSFTLTLPVASRYDLHIFNVAGQRVKTYEGHLEAGVHTLEWDSRNDQGVQVASGVYFYRARAGEFSETRTMMLLK